MPDYVTSSRGVIRDPNVPAAPAPAAAAPKAAAPSGSGSPRDGPPKKKAALAQPEEQLLRLSNERIIVPELLFRPNDIGIEQARPASPLAPSLVQCTTAPVSDRRASRSALCRQWTRACRICARRPPRARTAS